MLPAADSGNSSSFFTVTLLATNVNTTLILAQTLTITLSLTQNHTFYGNYYANANQ